MMVHPSLIQKVSLDERVATRKLVDEVKRCYLYVGPISVGKHEAADPQCNTMQMIIRLSKPYWKSSDPQGDEMWAEVRTWLKNKLYKVGSTMENYNTSHAEKGEDTLSFGRLELEMKSVAFGFALPTVDALPAVDEQVARYRELLNSGVLGDDAVKIEAPSKASWEAQWGAAVEEAERRAAQAVQEAQAARESASEDTEPACDADAIDPACEDAPTTCDDVPEQQLEEPAVPEFKPELVAVDYRLWDVVCADGTVRQLDSVAGAWL